MLKKDCLRVNIDGNKKLVNSEKVRFLIWNISAVSTCPYATPHCIANCYALKAEKQYPSCKEARGRNYEESLKDDFAQRMIDTITYYRNSKAFSGKYMIVRIHESGDFYSKEYADKWLTIINHFKNDNSIRFHCYTKSLPFFEDVNINKMHNLAFISSIWDDTSAEMLEMTHKNNYRTYSAVNSFDNWSGSKCRCEDCAHCMQCMSNNHHAIACEIH